MCHGARVAEGHSWLILRTSAGNRALLRVRSHGNTQRGIPRSEQELAPSLSGRAAAAAAGAGRGDAHLSVRLISAPEPAAIRRPGRQGHIPAAMNPPAQTSPALPHMHPRSRAELSLLVLPLPSAPSSESSIGRKTLQRPPVPTERGSEHVNFCPRLGPTFLKVFCSCSNSAGNLC